MGYSEATEARQIGNELICAYHNHLAPCRIEYLFNDRGLPKGRVAQVRIVRGLFAYLATPEGAADDPFFVVEIDPAQWAELTSVGRRAVVDHELTHCMVDLESGKLHLVDHDAEEFGSIVARYGSWNKRIQLFSECLEQGNRQLALEFSEDLDGAARLVEERKQAAVV